MIDQIQPLDAEEQKQFIEDTAYSASSVVLEDEFEGGSLPLTLELKRKAAFAIESRIKANLVYTQTRVAQINDNYNMVNRKIKEEDLKSDPVNLPETYISVEKWTDDLYLLFSNMDTMLSVKNDNNDQDVPEIMTLESSPLEQETPQEAMDYLGETVLPKEGLPVKPKSHVYWFRRENIIKSIIKRALNDSGFKKVAEEFFRTGIIGGQFILKVWPNRVDRQVLYAEDGENGTTGEIKYRKKSYRCLSATATDPRNLIFRKDGLEDGVIEIIKKVKFSELLSQTVDETGKPLEDPEYDYDELMKIRDEMIKSGGQTVDNTENATADTSLSPEIMELDGDITIAQGHFISMSLPGKGKKVKSQKCLITVAFLGSNINDACYPIQVRPYQFEKTRILCDQFSQRDQDVRGYGLPEIMLEIQRSINTLATLVFSTVKMGSLGVKVGDASVFEDQTKLQSLEAAGFIPVKLEPGQRISDAVQDFPVNISTIPYALNFIELLEKTLSKVSRKGFEGEKISPDPTATEANQIFRELEKSVDRVALRLNNLFCDFCKMLYEYAILNYEDKIDVQVDGYRNDGTNNDGSIRKIGVKKKISVDVRKFFIEDAKFELDIISSSQKTAVQKQQLMQFLGMVISNFGIIDPATGKAKTYVDDMGNTVEVDMFNLINMCAQVFDINQDDVWRKVQMPTQQQLGMPQMGAPAPEGAVPSPEVPPLSATPSEQSVMASVPTGA